MRNISNIVVHCTATAQNTTVEAIQNYWRHILKWKSPGYHYIILPDGTIKNIAPLTQICNGVAGHNSNSVHLSYIGGIDSVGKPMDNRTEAQRQSMLKLVLDLKKQFPHAAIKGHKDFPGVKKACPSFDVASWIKPFIT
jgi:N-acetylmuramoyl-L-alanine amidase